MYICYTFCRSQQLKTKAEHSNELNPETPPTESFPVPAAAGPAARRIQKPIQIQVEPLLDRGGLKISLPQNVAKNPRRVAKLFREQNILDMISFRSESVKSKSRNQTVSFTICPVVEGREGLGIIYNFLSQNYFCHFVPKSVKFVVLGSFTLAKFWCVQIWL